MKIAAELLSSLISGEPPAVDAETLMAGASSLLVAVIARCIYLELDRRPRKRRRKRKL